MIGTLKQLKDWLGEEGDKADDRLTAFLTRGSAFVNTYCRRTFESTTYTDELYDGSGTDVLLLNAWPATAVASLAEYGSALTVGSDPSANPDVLLYGDEGMLVRPGGIFIRGRRWYKVTYTAGYASDNMPAVVLEAALNYAALLNKEKDRVGMNSKTMGQQITSYTRELPELVRQGLDHYRDLSFSRRVA